jgi:hypothetical protein
MNQVQADALQALALELKHPCSVVGNVDDPSGNNRSAVVDTYHYRPPVAKVRDPYVAPQRERWMRRGQVVHVVGFTTGGRFVLEVAAVP